MRLCGKIVDFRRRHLFHDVDQAGRVGHVAVMEDELSVGRVVAEKKMIDTPGVEAGRAPLNTVDLIPLAEKELCKVCAVLAGDTGNKHGTHKNNHVNNNKRCLGYNRFFTSCITIS